MWVAPSRIQHMPCVNAGDGAEHMSTAAQAAQSHGLEMSDEDITQLKVDFEAVVKKYQLDAGEKSGQMADYLTRGGKVDTTEFAAEFEMEMRDANTMLMWIQIGTQFKTTVIDRNAELMREGKL